ncbi:uncharacterized protein H6S33_012055 [Morchella sextelata]|uniref:uncharacterized protein n=1 Tax=Morchella sextelata TaxID=1174677 RepID=UPI001D041B1E|nr:uncharacterized protein H6S33_012055 [Morchella sextelata]KAH0610528.1 hypothetical protein H6S33_012055 [Morchella sextelata]
MEQYLSLLPHVQQYFRRSPVVPAALALLTGGTFLYTVLRSPIGSLLPTTIESPRIELPRLTPEELEKLPYPPDVFPGARWVTTPYGTIRVYEWGPEDGRKVVFVHGIGSPCVVARDLLWELVEKGGCRVLVFDLYGRGYSDTPLGVPHDHRLYAAELIFALHSSPQAQRWHNFTLIGYSFGGGIAVAFAKLYPHLVRDLVLLAPSGLVRSSRLGVFARFAQAGYVPNAVAGWLAVRRTHGTPSAEVVAARGADPRVRDAGRAVDVEGIIEWQGRAHRGFLTAFLSSFRNGPLFDRQGEWAEVGRVWREERKRVLVVVAGEDVVIEPGLVGEMVELLAGGEEAGRRVVGRVFEGIGHDFVVRRGKEVAGIVMENWKGEGVNGM